MAAGKHQQRKYEKSDGLPKGLSYFTSRGRFRARQIAALSLVRLHGWGRLLNPLFEPNAVACD